MPAPDAPRRACKRCGHVDDGTRKFKGRVCTPCINEGRRLAYRFIPSVRARRLEQARAAYDPEVKRNYMRAYRARKKENRHDPA